MFDFFHSDHSCGGSAEIQGAGEIILLDRSHRQRGADLWPLRLLMLWKHVFYSSLLIYFSFFSTSISKTWQSVISHTAALMVRWHSSGRRLSRVFFRNCNIGPWNETFDIEPQIDKGAIQKHTVELCPYCLIRGLSVKSSQCTYYTL